MGKNFGTIVETEDSYWINANPSVFESGLQIKKGSELATKISESLTSNSETPVSGWSDDKYEKRCLKRERIALETYLSDTDYKVWKCSENGTSMKDTYPEVFTKRQESRDRINEIDEILSKI